jgi:peptidoglycan/xylan/chitin deacetylase (PgdA/CDA1 family)
MPERLQASRLTKSFGRDCVDNGGSRVLKKLIRGTLISSGATRLASRFTGVAAAILMYHSVMDDPSSEANTIGGIVHSAQVFRRQMELIARDYSPVSLADVLLFLKGEKELPHRAVAITFDDGYSDNLEVATPVLEDLGLTAAVYVAVDCLDKRTLPWPARLRRTFYTTKKKSWAENTRAHWPLTSFEQRDRAFLTACDTCCQFAGELQQNFVKRIEHELESELPSGSQRLMLTWEQVRELVRRGHIVGSHSMTHPNMAYLDDAGMHTEFADSKRRLEEELSSAVVHFSYPCPAMSPHWAPRTVSASREAGYETAVTITGGPVKRGDDPLSLRRVLPTKQVDGLRWNLERTFAGRRNAA